MKKRKRRTLRERFEEKFTPDPSSGCWPWKASTSQSGHGKILAGDRLVGAHRIAWEIYRGPIPANRIVCHKCNVPACVNPDHLYLGTKRSNARDALKAGKFTRERMDRYSHLTHCKRGHPFSGGNLYIRPGTGHRMCRACRKDYMREYHRQNH